MSCVLCLKGAIKFTFIIIIISLIIMNYVRRKKEHGASVSVIISTYSKSETHAINAVMLLRGL